MSKAPELDPREAQDGYTRLLGIEYLEAGDERGRARLKVTDDICQPAGIVQGGTYAVVAEALTSGLTARAVAADGMFAAGQASNSTFLRPIRSGHVTAIAQLVYRGRTTWVWDIDCVDDGEVVAAVVRCTVAVRPMQRP